MPPRPPPGAAKKKPPMPPPGAAKKQPPPPPQGKKPPMPPPQAKAPPPPKEVPPPDPQVQAEMEAMHDFWCDSERAATPLCVEIAQRRAALEAGTPLPMPGKRDAANRDEVTQMHDRFCAVEGNADSHPCKMWARKADRERRKKLRRRGGKPDFMEL